MSCAPPPAFWQRQPQLPRDVQDFLRGRTGPALRDPGGRGGLAWPMVLGAPRLRQEHPGGIPEEQLLARAAGPLAAVGIPDPREAWEEALDACPDLAQRGAEGWMPHQRWGAFGPLLSLRCGVALLVLTGLPADHQYPLAAAAGLHNACLFHECHEALEPLWDPAEGDLRSGLQGLILLAGGYHHQQFHQRGGAEALWRDALERATGTELPTPWGVLAFGQALDATAQRLRWMEANPETRDLAPLWEFPRPVWELK